MIADFLLSVFTFGVDEVISCFCFFVFFFVAECNGDVLTASTDAAISVFSVSGGLGYVGEAGATVCLH